MARGGKRDLTSAKPNPKHNPKSNPKSNPKAVAVSKSVTLNGDYASPEGIVIRKG